MYALSHNQSVVLDRESDQEKSLAPSGPRIRCALWLVAPQAEAWSVSTNKLLRYTIAESSRHIEQLRLLHFQPHFGLLIGVSGPETSAEVGSSPRTISRIAASSFNTE